MPVICLRSLKLARVSPMTLSALSAFVLRQSPHQLEGVSFLELSVSHVRSVAASLLSVALQAAVLSAQSLRSPLQFFMHRCSKRLRITSLSLARPWRSCNLPTAASMDI